MLGRLVNDRLKDMPPEEAWGDTLPYLAEAGLHIAHPLLRNDRSCLFGMMLDGGKSSRIELLPVSLNVAHVALARGEEFDAICAHMETLCAEFGTRLARRDDRLVWQAEQSIRE